MMQQSAFRPLWGLIRQQAWARQAAPAAWQQAVMQLYSDGGAWRTYSTQPDDEDKPTPVTRHPHFPALSSVRMQANLEEAEVAKSWDSLFTSPWFDLYDDPAQVMARRLTLPLRQLREALLSPIFNRLAAGSNTMVTNEIEGAFDQQEFLEGAGLALSALCEQVGARDWQALRQVCSDKLVERFQIAVTELESSRGLRLSSLQLVNLQTARLGPMSLWTADNIAKFDEGWAQEVTEDTSATFLVLAAGIRAVLQAEYDVEGRQPPAMATAVQAAEQPADHQGSSSAAPQRQACQLLREGSWLFARGPLPKGFSSQLHLPWRVLAVW